MCALEAASDVIVIGAGPAGLAVGACLKKEKIPCILLEQSDRVGATWHRHYDRLHLHTDKKNSELPFYPFPKEYPRYVSRAQVIHYLESYAQKFELDVRFHQQVLAVRFEKDQWQAWTQSAMYQAPNLVIAIGYNREPFLPEFPGQSLFKGELLHSSQYQNGERFKGKRVVVVGFGNSGGEIALDLWEHGAQLALAVRNGVNVIPRELFGIPILTISILQSRLPAWLADGVNFVILRAVIGDLQKYGLRRLSYGPVTQMRRDARIPLIDIGTVRQIKDGQITVHPGIREFTEDGIVFHNEVRAKFDAVVFATGYRPRLDTLLSGNLAAVIDENGRPRSSGAETRLPGLYFCGFYVSPTGMLREIGIEARRITASIARTRAET